MMFARLLKHANQMVDALVIAFRGIKIRPLAHPVSQYSHLVLGYGDVFTLLKGVASEEPLVSL